MFNRLWTVSNYITVGALGIVVGAVLTFLSFAAELNRGVEFTMDNGKKVLCIRTE